MALDINADNNIILRDIHCPYCNGNNALLISAKTKATTSFRFPAYGLKFILSFLYLGLIHAWRYGFKLFELYREWAFSTYGFCPNCGNSYSAGAPEEIKKEEMPEQRFYRIREGKAILGYCKGVSVYTGIPVLWIRILTVISAIWIIGAIIYFAVGICIPYKENENERAYRK